MVANTATCKMALSKSAIFKTDPTSAGRSPHPTVAVRPSRCISVPFATVPTFTERPQLWQELLEKLGKAHSTGLAHAVAVIGLGGTGKTQLALRYIEEHEKDYDTVLWIDVRSEETTQSSYERCCRTAGLPVEAATGDVPLQDIPAVQAVLSWLRSKGEDKRWLAVVDNVDDLSWDVSGIVPKGKAGTVIVTSQDAQAAQLLGGHTPTVKVDMMESEEAVRLLLSYFDESVCQEEVCLRLVKEIATCLDRLALAIDLAGARILADVEDNEYDLATALRQYLTDYRRYQGRLLRDEEFAQARAYKKTVWTAWETSLSSLRKAEDSQSDIYPVQLLRFMTLLDGSSVQDEIFRLGCLGLDESCRRLEVNAPVWMKGLLNKGKADEWDDFSYRASMRCLRRYGLVRPIGEPWKGITMHSIVQWRARVGMDIEEYWRLYLVFVGAFCTRIAEEADKVHFRRHIVMHLPANEELLGKEAGLEVEGMWWLWTRVANVLYGEGRWKEAEELDVKVMEASSRVLGEEHPDTLTVIANLASTYSNQGRWNEAEVLDVKVMEASSRVLGEEHPNTLTAMANLASTYRNQGRWKEAEELEVRVTKASSRVLGEEHPNTLTAMANLTSTYSNQGRWKEAEELDVKVMEASSRVLGEEHPDTLAAMVSLASTYRNQGHWKEAEQLDVKAMEASSRVLGEEHPNTLTAMANLASTYRNQGRWKEAEELFVHAIEARSRLLGEEHPDTLTAMVSLAVTYRNQGCWEEAEELFVHAVKARSRLLGEEHPDTLTAIVSLAATYRNQGRWKEAEELDVKAMEASSRVLGEEHPNTFTAMASMALTYSAQERWEEAEKLQGRLMEKRKEVLGERHPDTLASMEGLAIILNNLHFSRAALDLLETCIATSKLVFGAEHPYALARQGLKEHWLIDGDDQKEAKPIIAAAESRSPQPDAKISPTMNGGIDYCQVISHLITKCLDSGKDVHFGVHWELEQFAAQYLGEDKDLANCLTVTGNGYTAYATSCQQYVNWRWGDVGEQVLHSISGLLRDGAVYTPDFQLTASLAECQAKLFTRKSNVAIPIVQTLAWLASVFRIPEFGLPRCSTLQLLSGNGILNITLGRMHPVQSDNTTCWHSLLPNTTIAAGFPVRMSEQPGLDIEFEVMLDLADILFHTDLSQVSTDIPYGLFYSGAGRLLYPTSRSLKEKNVIMWHFDLSSGRFTPPVHHFLRLREQDLVGKRHVVGFASHSRVRLGTYQRARDYTKISPAAGCVESGRIEVTVETVTAQFGKAPVTASVGGKMKFSQALRATVDPEKRRYDQILGSTERQAVILFDCGADAAAWLVSQLSVILDLICYRIHKNGWRALPRHATPQADGGAAAAAVLRDPNVYGMELSELFENNAKLNVLQLVKEMYCAMSQRQILQELPTPATLRFHHERLYGWDLLELADPPASSFRREIVVHRTSSRVIAQSPSWLPLARHIPVYIGQDLGKVVTTEHGSLLHNIQNKEKYLMANVRAMRSLLGRRPGCDHFHLDCGLVWERPSRERSSPSDYVQRFINSNQHDCAADTGSALLCEEGVIVFGPEENMLIRFNNMLDRRMPGNITL